LLKATLNKKNKKRKKEERRKKKKRNKKERKETDNMESQNEQLGCTNQAIIAAKILSQNSFPKQFHTMLHTLGKMFCASVSREIYIK